MRANSMLAWAAAAFGLAAATSALTAEATAPVDAITSGTTGVGIRARYENVDQDGFTESADAMTARLRLNYATGAWQGWSGFVEFDHVFHLLNDFNSGAGTSPGKGQYPVVADPKGPDLNQLFVDYRPDEDWAFRVGRQRILLDDERFVGGVGWRQNEQTYDGITMTTSAIPRTALQYSYVSRIRRIFGSTVPAGRNDVETHLLNARISPDQRWSLTPYYYYIDNEDVPAFSTSTLGLRVGGDLQIADNKKVSLILEYATQSDVGNNPVEYDADYAYVDATLALEDRVTLGIAYQSLGGDATEPGMMFRTPLATLHKFQGWADMFLTTPSQGIDDLYATITFDVSKWDISAVYHDFSAAAGNGNYGNEFDVSAAHKLGQHHTLLIKGAFFSGDVLAYPDTNKFWVMLTASY